MAQPTNIDNVAEAIDLTRRAASLLEGATQHVINEVATFPLSADPASASALLTLSSQLLDAAALCRALTQAGAQIARALNAPAGSRLRSANPSHLRSATPGGILTPDESVTNPVDKPARSAHFPAGEPIHDLRSAGLGYPTTKDGMRD